MPIKIEIIKTILSFIYFNFPVKFNVFSTLTTIFFSVEEIQKLNVEFSAALRSRIEWGAINSKNYDFCIN